VLELHDVNSDQVLTSLWLRIRLITGHKKESSVHHSSASEHCCHQGVVAWTVDERNMSEEHHVYPALSLGSIPVVHIVITRHRVLHTRAERLEPLWFRTLWARKQLCVGITELDCDVSELLTEMFDGLSRSDYLNLHSFQKPP
jgi:hypothetical protein